MKTLLYKYKKEYIHLNYLLFFIPVLLIFYFLQKHIEPKYIISIPIDHKIPFIKQFIIPYVIWYGYVAWGFIYFAIHSKDDYYKLLKFILYGTIFCYTVYYFLPNGLNLRQPIEDTDILSRIILLIRSIDPPANVCPSLHVFDSIGVYIAIATSKCFQNRRVHRIFAFILTVSICSSTVFIKQHSLIDVIISMILSFIFYNIIYIVPQKYKKA